MHPNSSTSSSDPEPWRRFTLAFVATVAAFALGLVGVTMALGLEHYEDDLTQVGSFAENDYGWHGSQPYWPGVLRRTGTDLEQDWDVVIVGDSFSNSLDRPYWTWQLPFEAGTGLATFTLPETMLPAPALAAWLDGPAYKAHPPRVLIVECVERNLLEYFGLEALPPAPPRAPGRRPGPLHWTPRPVVPAAHLTRAPVRSWRPYIGGTKNYLVAEAERRLGVDTRPAVSLQLARTGLFSNRLADRALFYRPDGAKRSWRPEQVAAIARNLAALAARAEANGVTRFVLMVPPDKLTAYDAVLARPEDRAPSWIGAIAAGAPFPMPRLDLAFQDRVRRGMRDLYLPNDTHWGGEGHMLAAADMVDALVAAQVLAPRTVKGRSSLP